MSKINSFTIACIVALLLLSLPVLLLLLNWRWHADVDYPRLGFLFLITQTVSQPWGILCTLFFITMLYLRLPATKCDKWRAMIACLIVIVAGQLTAKILKPMINETRPFVSELTISSMPAAEIHNKRACHGQTCQSAITKAAIDKADIADWQRQHWLSNLNGSFPSGHSLFASGWAIWIILLLWQHRCYLFGTLTVCWAIGVMYSRMLLGMHWPVDVIGSVLISWLLTIIVLIFYSPGLASLCTNRRC